MEQQRQAYLEKTKLMPLTIAAKNLSQRPAKPMLESLNPHQKMPPGACSEEQLVPIMEDDCSLPISDNINWTDAYLLAKNCTKSTKLIEFQFKFLQAMNPLLSSLSRLSPFFSEEES